MTDIAYKQHTEFVLQILALTARYDVEEDLMWNPELQFFVLCSDCFNYATADAEEVTPATLPELVEALEDGGEQCGMLLYCARRRKMRPLTSVYPLINEEYRHFFDVCGPER